MPRPRPACILLPVARNDAGRPFIERSTTDPMTNPISAPIQRTSPATLVRGSFALLCLALLAAGCEPAERLDAATVNALTPAAAAPQLLEVTATDFAFQTRRSIPAGLTTIRLHNAGRELHHVQLVKLAKGRTLEELMRHLATSHEPPRWAVPVGGPNSPAPGGRSEGTLRLEPGEYAMLCMIPSPDGVAHVAKGMAASLTVTAPSGRAETAPAADVRMKLVDYGYEMDEPLRAGRRTVRVENLAEQPHEVFFVRLAPGKNPGDMLRWIEKPQGPPPGEPVGGTTFIAKGGVNYITADFAAGEYALYCFVPDHKDGKPHIAHGMVRQISVTE